MVCKECGTDITWRRDSKSKRAGLCPHCRRKERMRVYGRQYYRERIAADPLWRAQRNAKSRQWQQENKEQIAERRRARRTRLSQG